MFSELWRLVLPGTYTILRELGMQCAFRSRTNPQGFSPSTSRMHGVHHEET